MPIDPGRSRWDLPDPATAGPGVEVVAVGGALDAPTALAGYRSGLFAMRSRRALFWYSPDPRGVLPVEGFHASRSLRRSCRAFEVSVDQAFDRVLDGCADPGRGGRWIDAAYRSVYAELFALGWAHSVEVWVGDDLAGGLLGVESGGLFCGESMFHRATDASKAALWVTCALLGAGGAADRLFDVQWLTDHLASLGAIEVPRSDYLRRLPGALAQEPALGPIPRRSLPGLLASLTA